MKLTNSALATENILILENLEIGFNTPGGLNVTVDNLSLNLRSGEILGIVGESGSGKSTVLMSILNYLPAGALKLSGRIMHRGDDLCSLSGPEMRKRMGRHIGIVYQDPTAALNPTMRVGRQAVEVRCEHFEESVTESRKFVLKLFERVGLVDAERVFNAYPHEISGGQRQRVMIAMAMAGEPEILLLDEPTTALDLIVQARVLSVIRDITKSSGISAIFVSHDLGAISSICDRVAVMYRGKLEECGPTNKVLNEPSAEYTKRLVAATPKVTPKAALTPLTVSRETVLEIDHLQVIYGQGRDMLGRKKPGNMAVEDLSLTLKAGDTVAVVGESGSGKSTLARAVLQLAPITAGRISLLGQDIASASATQLRLIRRKTQMVFQNPNGSLNPKHTVHQIVSRPLQSGQLTKAEIERAVADIIASVGLTEAHLRRMPSQLSGGEKQRVAIARAFITNPSVVILDEPTTALDVSVQAAVLDLLDRLQKQTGCAYLFISHDLAVVSQIANRVLVMRNGQVCEAGTTSQIFNSPEHPYTSELLGAILSADR